MTDDALLREEVMRRLAVSLSMPTGIVVLDDSLAAMFDHLPRAEYDAEQLPDGSLALKFRDLGPPYADGGTLIIPASLLDADGR
jgi:hypothetical protein